MKITKRQLRRIIKEEKAKLMRESPQPGSGTQEEWQQVERENTINFLIEDGVTVEMDSPLTNEQLHAILKIVRGQTKVGMG